MKDAFGVSKGFRMKFIPKYAKRSAARSAGAKARRAVVAAAHGQAPPKPVPPVNKPWYRKGTNQLLIGGGALAVGGGAVYGYKKSQQPVAKSFVKVGGKILQKTPKEMKALGLKPASHKAMQGVTPEDAKKSKDLHAAWNALRPVMEGKQNSFAGLAGINPVQTTKVRGRKVNISELPENTMANGFQVAIPTKGKGQRQAQHLVATSHLNRNETLRHELQHANKRKPLSSAVRHSTDQKRGWMEEARADSAMKYPSDSGYELIARGKSDAPTAIGKDPRHMRRYLKTRKKIEAAQGNSYRKPFTLKRVDNGEEFTVRDGRTRVPRPMEGPRPKFHVSANGETVRKSMIAPGVWKPAVKLSGAERVVVRNGNLHRSVRFPPKDTFVPKKTSPLFRRALYRDKPHRVLGQHSKDRFFLQGANDERILVHRSNLTPIKD